MIQSGDFVKLNYTGKLSDGTVFDTTDPVIAKKEGLEGAKAYRPIVICIGQGMLVPGLDAALIGRSVGPFTLPLTPDQGFGRKDPKLLRIVPTQQLLQQQIRPYVGLRLNIDGEYGTVRSVSSGRTVVDFNHPLASQDVTYDVDVLEIVKDEKTQIEAIFNAGGIPFESVAVTASAATVKLAQLFPKPLLDALQSRITQLTSVKTVSFEQGTAPAKKTVSQAQQAHDHAAHSHAGHDHAGHDHADHKH